MSSRDKRVFGAGACSALVSGRNRGCGRLVGARCEHVWGSSTCDCDSMQVMACVSTSFICLPMKSRVLVCPPPPPQDKNLSAAEQQVSPDPDVRCVTLTRHDTFMVLACDGLWNALPEQQVTAVDLVHERVCLNRVHIAVGR